MLKKWLKKSVLWKIITWTFDTLFFPKHLFLKYRITKDEKVILLVGTPLYDNLGDHLIAEKELEWLKDHYPDYSIIEIPTPIFIRYESFLAQNTDPSIKVYITGGGWMGDIWPDDEKRMQRMLACFSKNQLTVFPQTVYYELNNKESEELLSLAKQVYTNCHSLTMCFRDKQSYEFAQKQFQSKNVKIRFTPDMALYNFKNKSSIRSNTVGICLRKDRECNRNVEFEDCIKQWMIDKKYTSFAFSTITKNYIPSWSRKRVIKRLIRQLESVDIVVTDRLHGMIIALLAGCKCIAIDNKTHKVSGVYHEWLSKYQNVQLLDGECDCEDLRKVLNSYLISEDNMTNSGLPDFNDKFQIM